MKRLSIIVPVYNTEPYICRCLDSMINQIDILEQDYEIIVLNDGSTDNSGAIIKKYQNKYPNLIRAFSHPNCGLSVTRNKGLNRAEGEYIWFVDSDDYIPNYAVSSIIAKMAPNIDGIAISYTLTYDDTPPKNIILKNCSSGIELLHISNHNPAQFCIFRKDFLDSNNLRFIENCLHEDVDFSTRAKYKAVHIRVIDKPLYSFYQRQVSASRGNKNPKRAFDCIAIANSLYQFAITEATPSHYYLFARAIGIVVNISLALSCHMDSPTLSKFSAQIKSAKKALTFLRFSNNYKLKLEGIVSMISPCLLLKIKHVIG